ncbi:MULTISPECIES: nitrite reductase small subunit NirD [Paenibacillus]|uniref:nitrite reductase small subunit NirD n=1 Tax=Paenibacillus TaxID=44249 RepID=UPI0025B6F44E|nr:nitrite reductase small subunit NirD [Paenibacillus polymyxa]MDN4082320.1 nitrite reductase small subunit NirD [Paenibacillus polymyxa]MDN4088203.1 nitrite reductase small subunit NirD [Paenibacillus polymyxa]MDN4107652.1 nitrite reductase small subunit NirD [Paenibacillus polymyxa]
MESNTTTSRIRIADLNEIDRRGARTVHIHNAEIAVFRLSDGSVRALENRCPHKGGRLSEGMICGSVVHCPLHDWKVDLSTGQVQEPDTGCVTTYPTEIDSESGAVYIVI